MSDGDPMAERSVADRLKRRRARGEAGGLRQEAAEPFDFGYGGWSVTLQDVPFPEPVRHVVTPTVAPRERLRATRGEAVDAPSMGRADGPERLAEPRQRPEEDRPLIAPPPPPRRRGAAGRGGADRVAAPEGPAPLAEGSRNRKAQRIAGGGTVVIDDALYPLVDWSTGGIAIRSEGHLYRIGDRRVLELEIDLNDYAVNLDLEGEVMNRSSERTGWRFVAPTETQRQVLRALTQASLFGKTTTLPRGGGGGRAVVAGSGDGTAGRARSRRRRGHPIAGLLSLPFNAVVVLLAAGVAGFALTGGERPAPAPAGAGSIQAEAAAVAVEGVALRSPRGGLVLEWAKAPGARVVEGEPLVSYTADAAGGAREVVLAPCDCFLARVLVEPGERMASGEDLALLYRAGLDGHVQALFPPDAAVSVGDPAAVRLRYTGDEYEGVVEAVGAGVGEGAVIGPPARTFGERSGGGVVVRIRTTPSLPAALAGDPAFVTVRPEA